jgi:hypothetical protein
MFGMDYVSQEKYDKLNTKANKLEEALKACHDSMVMSRRPMTHLRSFKMAVKALEHMEDDTPKRLKPYFDGTLFKKEWKKFLSSSKGENDE